jgi:hypothetical protein
VPAPPSFFEEGACDPFVFLKKVPAPSSFFLQNDNFGICVFYLFIFVRAYVMGQTFQDFVAPLVRLSVRTWDVNPDSQLPRRPLTAQQLL